MFPDVPQVVKPTRTMSLVLFQPLCFLSKGGGCRLYKWIGLIPRRRAQEQSGITAIVQAVPVLQLAQDLASNIKRHGLMVGGCTI